VVNAHAAGGFTERVVIYRLMEASSSRRLDGIDLVRGLVMVIMLLDHTRDFTHASGMLYDPLDSTKTTPIVYLTR
jgi:uncharacterized membrane protein